MGLKGLNKFLKKTHILQKIKDVWSYTYTIRNKEDGQTVETRTQIDKREYSVINL